MGRGRSAIGLAGVLAALCALWGAASASASPAAKAPAAEIAHTQPSGSEAERLLAVHNAERLRLGLPPLVWNAALARDAGDYATVLARRGELAHASPAERKGKGENLWMGTAGAWSVESMVEAFLDERRDFRPATFPEISRTGNWADVGHYSQIVWGQTREVGCSIESGKGMDVLVCRYSPPGNVFGQIPY